MKIRWGSLLRCIVTCILLAAMLAGATYIVTDKRSYEKYIDFYRAEHGYDVIMLGTSHMYNTVSCMQMWNEYGIAAYNFAYANSYVPESYWVLRSLLQYAKPKAVVLDLYQILDDEMYRADRIEQRHVQYDSMPLSLIKVQAVMDQFAQYENRLDFIWPFIMYHSRWDSLTKKDFTPQSRYENGSELLLGRSEIRYENPEAAPRDDLQPFDSLGLEYARRIEQLCEEEGIALILTVIPYASCTLEEQRRYHYVASELKSAEYIDMTDYEDIWIPAHAYDYGHLNLAGASVVTKQLSEYLLEHGYAQNRRKDEQYTQIQQVYSEYYRNRRFGIRRMTDTDQFLVRLYDTCFALKVSGDPRQAGLDDVQMYLLEQFPRKVQGDTQDGVLRLDVYDLPMKNIIDSVMITDGKLSR